MKNVVIVFAAITLLTGCGTNPVALKDAVGVPSSRVTLPTTMAGSIKAVFVRDSGFTGGGIHQHVTIDGVDVATLERGEKVEFMLRPGEHIFGVVPVSPFMTFVGASVTEQLNEDKQYYYRISMQEQTVLQRFVP